MVGGHERNGLRWIAEAYDVSFTLTLSDDHISDLDSLDWEDEAEVARLTDGGFLPDPPDTIVRAGSVAGWAYALEEFQCHTGTYLAALSQRGRAFSIHRNAKGFSRIGYALHGEPVTVELDLWIPWEETEAELPAAAFNLRPHRLAM